MVSAVAAFSTLPGVISLRWLFNLRDRILRKGRRGRSSGAPAGDFAVTIVPINGVAVLGSGRRSCCRTYENVLEAVRQLGLQTEVLFISEPEEILIYGVTDLPALVINGEVISTGRALSCEQVVSCFERFGYFPRGAQD